MRVADMVLDELLRIIGQLEAQELQRFKVLRTRVLEVANNSLRKCVKPTNKMIESIIDCELAYINTSHPDFIGTQNLMSSLSNAPAEGIAKLEGAVEDVFQSRASSSRAVKDDSHSSSSGGGGFFSAIFGSGGGSSGSSTSRTPSSKPKTEPIDRMREVCLPVLPLGLV